MLNGNWLKGLPGRAFERRRSARAQVGVYRSAVHLIAARLRSEDNGAVVVEQLHGTPIGTGSDQEACQRLIHSGIFQKAAVVLALAPDQYTTHSLPSPSVPDGEMREALRWQLREVLPYAPEDAVVDFIRLARVAESSGPPGLLVVATPRRTVAHAVAPLLAAGIEVSAVDIPELAQRNLLARLPGSGAGQALLSVDQSSGLLTVIANNELCFARRILMPRADVMEEEDPEHVAMRVATQIQRSVEVVERQSGLPPVRTVWIGPHAYAALISRCTAEQTGIDCPQLDLQAELRFAAAVPLLAPEMAAGALLAIGAALRSERADTASIKATQSVAPSWLARLKAAA